MKKLFQLGGFILIASQLQLLKLLESMVNCSLDNLEIISIVYYKRPLGEMCDCKNWKYYKQYLFTLAWFSQNRWYDEFNRLLFMLKILCCCCSLFGFNVTFNNFSFISRRCLVATGSSTLTFIVLPHWSMHQTLDIIQHLITLSWHLGRPV